MDRRTPPGVAAFALMLLLCATWGFQQVTIKIASEGISPVLQAGLRSAIALLLLLGWARWRRLPLAEADGTLRCGLLAGLLFALEFVFIYVGLSYTTASRMIVVLYTAPCLTVLGLHLFVAVHQDDLTTQAIVEQLRSKLEPVKVPDQVHVVDALPKTGNRKIDRNALKARLAS